jgi:hypothetical protein
MPACRLASKATIAFGEEFLYELKAGPAGGRLRRPSSRRQRHNGHRGTGLTLPLRRSIAARPEAGHGHQAMRTGLPTTTSRSTGAGRTSSPCSSLRLHRRIYDPCPIDAAHPEHGRVLLAHVSTGTRLPGKGGVPCEYGC